MAPQLIKDAARALLAELPNLKSVCTLSPMPLFKRWLMDEVGRARRRPKRQRALTRRARAPACDASSW